MRRPRSNVASANFALKLRLVRLKCVYWFRPVLELWSRSGFFVRQTPFHAPLGMRVKSTDRH